MKTLLTLMLLMPMLLKAQTVTWSWEPVTEAVNGQKITPDYYNLYCTFGNFTTKDNKFAHDLEHGRHGCKVSTMYKDNESDITKEYEFTVLGAIPQMPNMPKIIKVEAEISLKITFQ